MLSADSNKVRECFDSISLKSKFHMHIKTTESCSCQAINSGMMHDVQILNIASE